MLPYSYSSRVVFIQWLYCWKASSSFFWSTTQALFCSVLLPPILTSSFKPEVATERNGKYTFCGTTTPRSRWGPWLRLIDRPAGNSTTPTHVLGWTSRLGRGCVWNIPDVLENSKLWNRPHSWCRRDAIYSFRFQREKWGGVLSTFYRMAGSSAILRW